MTKKKTENEPVYEYMRATVVDGELSWNYRVLGYDRDGGDRHHEDVSDWTDDDIIDLTMRMFDVPEVDRKLIQIERD